MDCDVSTNGILGDYLMLFQLTILQLFSFEDAKDADNSLLEARGKDISIFLIFCFYLFLIF